MNGSMHESELGVTVAQPFNSSDAPVSRAIIYDPEHTAGIIVGRSGHDLLDEAIITEAEVEELDREAKEESNAAVQFAEESPLPEEREILTDIYWEVDHQTEAAKYGRYFFNS